MIEAGFRLNKTDEAFLQGVLCALRSMSAHMDKYSFSGELIFDQTVHDCGEGPLIWAARRSGNMRRSGLSKYLRRRKV